MERELLAAGFQAAAALIESGLNGNDAKLPVFNFTMRGHHPDEIYRMTRHRNVRVETFRHDHGIAVTNNADKLRLVRVGVDELHSESWRRHVVVDIQLFQHFGVFMRRPTGPVARLGRSKAGENAAGFNVFPERYIHRACI